MIPFLDLKLINAQYRNELIDACTRVIDSGWYIGGGELTQFEQEFAEYCGSTHCIGVANGLDALTLTLRAWMELGRLQPGDEVIVPANTYIASILSISANGLIPVLVEPNEHSFNLCPLKARLAITNKTRVILPVHLYGRIADMPAIMELAREHALLVLEDSAQSHGASIGGKRAGSWGDAAGLAFIQVKTSERWAMQAPSPPTTTNSHKHCTLCATMAATKNTKIYSKELIAVWMKSKQPYYASSCQNWN